MNIPSQGLSGPNRTKKYVFITHNALCISALVLVAAIGGEAAFPVQSPRAKLEQMIRGAPIPDSTTSALVSAEWTRDLEPQAVSQMSPADRFRLIIQAESQVGDESVQVESTGVLHPIQVRRPRRLPPRRGVLGKLALGAVPSAALFSQVLFGSRMKATVLDEGRVADVVDGAAPCSVCAPEKVTRRDRVVAALTSKTAIGITAAAASIAALYLFIQELNRRRKRHPGLLSSTTAKWELQQCLLIVDILGAQTKGSIQGKYVANSASLQVDVSTQHATLTYSRIPAFTRSPLKWLMRKVDTIKEHFYLPAEHCFIGAKGSSETQSFNGLPRSYIQEYTEKGSFGRERVAALTIHAERSPGFQVLHQAAAPPGPPSMDLLDAIRLKHQTSGENAAEMEEPPMASQKDAAVERLEHLVSGEDFCGGTVLCVDSVSISTSKSLCTVQAAVEDMRPISVLANVAQQTVAIVVEADQDTTEEGALQTSTAQYNIALPRHCVLADASNASYAVAHFSVDVEGELNLEKVPEPLESSLQGSTGETDNDTVSVEPETQSADEHSEVVGDGLGIADGISTEVTELMKGDVNSGAVKSDLSSNSSKRTHYQHICIQFKPLPKSELRVSLKLLPQKQLHP